MDTCVQHAATVSEVVKKTCSRCKGTKPRKNFPRDASRADGIGYWCKACRKETRKKMSKSDSRRYARKHREKIGAGGRKRKDLQSKYGITLDEYLSMVQECKNRCECCGKKPNDALCVDHDHNTGEVRGLLCRQCNAGIGLLQDTREGVEKALDYLRRTS